MSRPDNDQIFKRICTPHNSATNEAKLQCLLLNMLAFPGSLPIPEADSPVFGAGKTASSHIITEKWFPAASPEFLKVEFQTASQGPQLSGVQVKVKAIKTLEDDSITWFLWSSATLHPYGPSWSPGTVYDDAQLISAHCIYKLGFSNLVESLDRAQVYEMLNWDAALRLFQKRGYILWNNSGTLRSDAERFEIQWRKLRDHRIDIGRGIFPPA